MLIYNTLLIVQIVVALSIIGLVLIQHGKGADAGAAFGGGASGSVFGSRGSGNFLSRATAILAAIFFANSLALAWLVAHRDTGLTAAQSVVPVEKAREVRPAPVVEPSAPSDVPTNIGQEKTKAVTPVKQGEAPADVPVQVIEPAAPAKQAAPADIPAQVIEPVAPVKQEVPVNVPAQVVEPVAPADLSQ